MTTLTNILERAQERKFLGSLPLERHFENGAGFVDVILRADAVGGAADCSIVDLGSGGGIPALVIAELLPEASLLCIERGRNRAEFLTEAIEELGIGDRVSVAAAAAETVARSLPVPFSFDVVTARSFAAPAVTAECACRFLRLGGRLLVSEPPTVSSRWDDPRLGATGLEVQDRVEIGTSSFQVLCRTGPVAERLPRRDAVTRKRPLF